MRKLLSPQLNFQISQQPMSLHPAHLLPCPPPPHPPPVVCGGQVHMLDLAAKLDQTADFICKVHWGEIEFPPPFGREAMPEVRYGAASPCVDCDHCVCVCVCLSVCLSVCRSPILQIWMQRVVLL